MKRTALMGAVLAGVFALAAPAFAEPAPPALVADLRARDQAMLDGFASGDQSPFDRVLAPTVMYLDENGDLYDRKGLLDTVRPLPAGASGVIRIVDYRVELHGDTAIVFHRDDETEDYHGHLLKAQYLMTEAWVKGADGWKVTLWHAYVVAKDPPAIEVAPAVLDAYVGRYRAGPGLKDYVITRDGNDLSGGREGGTRVAIKVESGDVLFRPGDPRWRLIFQRDASGRVTGFIERREGEDLLWVRTP
jgi:ketosteroid isomerase-like protein